MNKKEQSMAAYVAPQVEVIEIAVEQGFAVSGYACDSDDSEFGQ